MYESFFEFEARPFLAAPVADRYYPAAAIEHARETVARCIERSEGPAVVLGSAGTGKSMLCQVLAQQLRDKFRVATLASARLCTRRALLQNILFELKQPYRDREEGELRLSLIDFLEPSEACPHGMLLFVDEAHMLPLRLLEEIRMLTNLVRDGQPRVRLVLAASLLLDERLASPRLESFNQRIAARCYLQSMNRDETFGYVRAQLSAVGGQPEQVFTEEALCAIYRATDGIPRLVNQVCDHVLIMAAVGQQKQIDAAGVEEAWADLQQLPSPWSSRDEAAVASCEQTGILEFGELDEPSDSQFGESVEVTSEQSVDEPAEPVEPPATPEPQVTARLDEVESGIASLAAAESNATTGDESEEQQFLPTSDKKPEIELVFHHAHDPFRESFDHEEVVVDPVGSLDSLGGSAAIAPSAKSGSPTIPFVSGDGVYIETDDQEDAEVSDTLRHAVAESMNDAVDMVNAMPGDDRDLLEIYEDRSIAAEQQNLAMADHPPRRREYRQLFANLRRR
jgi:type II secretory pathway predicted ATPase ExeA